MTILGIDGNQWYVTQKGSCLGDPRDKFCFGDTPREAFTKFYNGRPDLASSKHSVYMDMTVDEYKKTRGNYDQFRQ